MSLVEIFFLAVALAMDCFVVSIVSGVILRQRAWSVILRMALFFGLFQAAMPLAGWLATHCFSDYIETVDHWIAFGLLTAIGIKMIRESFAPEEEKHFDPRRLRTQLTLAVATSIDALAIGISFACTGYGALGQLAVPLLVIGLVSFLFGVFGQLVGIRFGDRVARAIRPELIGGLILIAIGIKILLSHLAG